MMAVQHNMSALLLGPYDKQQVQDRSTISIIDAIIYKGMSSAQNKIVYTY